MKRALITGAGGFIGHHLVSLLLERGVETACFLRYTSTSSPGLLKYVPGHLAGGIIPFYGDIRDPRAVRRAAEGCDTVFHLAALVGIPYSYGYPGDVVSVNVGGTQNVLDACRETGARVVVTSTSEVYGTAADALITEEHRLHAQSPYAASKTAGDQLALSYRHSYGMPVAICRPFNTYGPGQSRRAVIPTIITQALWENRIELGSTEPTRDFLYVSDTARGFAGMGENPDVLGRAVQLGTGREISVGDLAGLILDILGMRGKEIVSAGERKRPEKGEVMRLAASPALAERIMGWRPQVSLEEGLQVTARWIADHRELYAGAGYAV